MAISIDQRVDVTVSLGSQPISTAEFDSVIFLADLLDANFPQDFKIYNNITDVAADFNTTDPSYIFASLVFGGNFPPKSLYVVKYGATNATPLTPAQALTNMLAVDDTAYYVACESHTQSDIQAVVSVCEANNRMYVVSSQEADILNQGLSTDIGSILKTGGYKHVITLYDPAADAGFSEGGIVGAMAAIQPGVSTLEDKTMPGVDAYNASATDITSMEAKNVAYYAPIAGVNSVFNSKTASGNFFDAIVFSDWLQARIGEAVYGLLKRESDLGRKVTYDEAGMTKIRQAIFQPINQALSVGALSSDFTPIVRTPTRDEVTDADRANRFVPNVVVEVVYSNGVHNVKINAYVTV